MPWIEENSKTYWLPEAYSENTDEHNFAQEKKKYLTNDGYERQHPKWTYDNGSLVDDEYLFYNEGWKLLIEDPFEPSPPLKKKVKNPVEEWEEVNERTLKITYNLEDLTEEEKNIFVNDQWFRLREKRNFLLIQTDYVIIRSYESGLVVSDELKSYRQQLRDFPQTFTDDSIALSDLQDDSIWPSKPQLLFQG